MRSRRTPLLLALLGVVFAVGLPLLTAARPWAEEAAPVEVRAVPEVTGEILDLAAAPDSTRIALAVSTKDGKTWRHQVIIFAPAEGRIVSRIDAPAQPGGLFWSRDSALLAVTYGKNYVHLLGRDGGHTAPPLKHNAYNVFWPANDPPRFFYDEGYVGVSGVVSRAWAWDVAPRKERNFHVADTLAGFFNVNGMPAYSWVATEKDGNATVQCYYAIALGGQHVMLRMASPGMLDVDYSWLEVSPDGKYLYLQQRVKTRVVEQIAAVAVANRLLTHPERALYLSRTDKSLQGPPRWSPGIAAGHRFVLLGTTIVDLDTKYLATAGARLRGAGPANLADWWTEPGAKKPGLIVVTPEGLWMPNNTLALAHHPQT